jgi:hypothetical protein
VAIPPPPADYQPPTQAQVDYAFGKGRTAAQRERQDHRKKGGQYAKVNPCECCGKSAGVNYYSDDRCNGPTGLGLVLCSKCASKLAKLPDDQYEAAFPKA